MATEYMALECDVPRHREGRYRFVSLVLADRIARWLSALLVGSLVVFHGLLFLSPHFPGGHTPPSGERPAGKGVFPT